MKSNPLLIACTFLLGVVVTLVIATQLRDASPVQAQGSTGDGSIKGFYAMSHNDFIVVFREVDSTLKNDNRAKRMSMALYSVRSQGTDKSDLYFQHSRYIDWDLMTYGYVSPGSKASPTVAEVRKEMEKIAKELEEEEKKRAKEEEKEKKKDEKKDDKK